MKKRLFALTLSAALMLGAVGVTADDGGKLYINGSEVADTMVEGDRVMVPVREAAEALGYNVEWIADTKTVVLNSGASYVTFAIGVDGYTFAKTAPMPLGKAAEIVDGKTMVPAELFSDILEYTVNIEGGDVSIAPLNQGTATVTEKGGDRLVVEDMVRGQVVLMIGEDTAITDDLGAALTLDDVATGAAVEVVYGDAMTMSIPPINNPVSIVVTSQPQETPATEETVEEEPAAELESLYISGEVTEVDETGLIVVTSDDEDAAYPVVALVVTDATEGDGVDAQVGDKVEASFSQVMTRSIPPQAEAFSINLK